MIKNSFVEHTLKQLCTCSECNIILFDHEGLNAIIQ